MLSSFQNFINLFYLQNQRKNKKFRKQHQKYIQDKKNGFKENSDLKTFIKHVTIKKY